MATSTEFLLTDPTGQEIRDAILLANAIFGPSGSTTGQSDSSSGQSDSTSGHSGTIYGFHVEPTKSGPSEGVAYLMDAVGMTPAGMDYTNGVFSYGSWENAFFMPRPCLLNRDGTVACYLKADDYTKKEDGTDADITGSAFTGNAMMEWGQNGKKIWFKAVPDNFTDGGYSVFIADHQADPDYHAWSFINNQGDWVDHFYTPIYGGSLKDNVLRSISGQPLMAGRTAEQELGFAMANNEGGDTLWLTETFSDHILIQYLLILIGKSLDSQSVFGCGIESGGQSECQAYRTGQLNDKGLFFGYNDGAHTVKVFGMENYWACQWRRKAGCVNDKGTYRLKYTYGTQDGSAVNGYPTTGLDAAAAFAGYIASGSAPNGNGRYIRKMRVTPEGAIVPSEAAASSGGYYCDYMWSDNGQVDYACFGGAASRGAICGLFAWAVDDASSGANWDLGASLSCKPLA